MQNACSRYGTESREECCCYQEEEEEEEEGGEVFGKRKGTVDLKALDYLKKKINSDFESENVSEVTESEI